jgi:hypothetical protein
MRMGSSAVLDLVGDALTVFVGVLVGEAVGDTEGMADDEASGVGAPIGGASVATVTTCSGLFEIKEVHSGVEHSEPAKLIIAATTTACAPGLRPLNHANGRQPADALPSGFGSGRPGPFTATPAPLS